MGWSRIGRRYGIFEEGSDVGGLEEIQLFALVMTST
jgi:hypothetical protein